MIRTGRQAGALTAFVAGAALSGLACTGSVMGGGEPGSPRGNPSTNPGPNNPSNPSNPAGPNAMPTPEKPVTPPPPVTAENAAGPAVFRRLTMTEFKNTLRDLIGIDGNFGDLALADDKGTTTGFTVGAEFVQAADASKFYNAVEKLTATLPEKLAGILPKSCNLADNGQQDACVGEFIDNFGLRAYRRPVTTEEKADLVALYGSMRGAEGGATFAEAMANMVRAMIQSPQFLYRWELGELATKDGSLVKYNNYEIASRLSYFLWTSMPDDKLFDAAKNNRLNDLQTIANESRRMLADNRAKNTIRNFHLQWLGIEGMDTLPKDPSFKDYNQEVGKAFIEETVTFANNILWGDKATGKVQDLLTSSTSYIDGRVGKIYGANATGTEMKPVQLDPAQRAGILTHGSFLGAHADGDFSHPVKRGVHVLRHIMCNPIPDPPKTLEIPTLPEPKPGVTTRERFEEHVKAGPTCSGCHDVIDPIGFAFEHYDAVGGFRTMEENKPIKAGGSTTLASGKKIDFKDGVDFAKKLAEEPEVRSCVAKHWVRYLLRREEVKEETGSIDAIVKAFESSQWDMREMLVATTTTRAFTHRKLIEGEATK